MKMKRYTYDDYIKKWKAGEVTGGKGDEQCHGKVSDHVRKYLFEKYKNKCARCNWSETNKYTKTIPLEVEHKDGNPMNHKEENLTLLCPNCHSLTKGHSTSKGNGRRYYREKYHKEKRAGGDSNSSAYDLQSLPNALLSNPNAEDTVIETEPN